MNDKPVCPECQGTGYGEHRNGMPVECNRGCKPKEPNQFIRCQAWHELSSGSLTVRQEYSWGCANAAVPGGRFCKEHGGTSECAADPKEPSYEDLPRGEWSPTSWVDGAETKPQQSPTSGGDSSPAKSVVCPKCRATIAAEFQPGHWVTASNHTCPPEAPERACVFELRCDLCGKPPCVEVLGGKTTLRLKMCRACVENIWTYISKVVDHE